MADSVVEKAVCLSCGADVREGTAFCYACGKPVLTESSDANIVVGSIGEAETPEIENSDEKPVAAESERSDKLAAAAAERKKSRVGQRKPKKVIWEEPGAASNRIFLLVCILISVIAAAIVFLMVFVR